MSLEGGVVSVLCALGVEGGTRKVPCGGRAGGGDCKAVKTVCLLRGHAVRGGGALKKGISGVLTRMHRSSSGLAGGTERLF